jgi:hypothetical protein
VYLALRTWQHGAVDEAIKVLKEGSRRFKRNVAILTSSGADLERNRADDEALDILTNLRPIP